MLNENFIYAGALLSLIGSLDYVIATIKGKNKPNRISWFFWFLAPFIAFSAEIMEGVKLQALMTFMVGFGPFLVFVASFFNKKAYWKLGRTDYIFGALSLLGLVLWFLTGNGNIAIVFAILADGLAAVPTIIKSWKEPETEGYLVFLFGAINALITLLTIKVPDFAHLAFPIYILLICALFVALIKFKVGKRLRGRWEA